MISLSVKKFSVEYLEEWDKFILNDSINGTFLQSRNFLNYHPKDRFVDDSLMFYKGSNTLVAVIPACTVYENDKKIFYSHLGSTFGGIVVNNSFNNIEHVEAIVASLNSYLRENNYNKIYLKNTSQLFSSGNTNLIEYLLFKEEYSCYDEISFFIDFKDYKEDIISNFTASRRRDYKYSLKNNLKFKKLITSKEVENFYYILCSNLKKFNSKPVHALNELIDFKDNRLKDIVEFYGVYNNDILIAGSMIFKFDKKVFHTQYLAANQDFLKLFPMNFLDTNLINVAKEEGFRYFSFGISTEDHGQVLNTNLAQFKEGFGSTYSINKTYYKTL